MPASSLPFLARNSAFAFAVLIASVALGAQQPAQPTPAPDQQPAPQTQPAPAPQVPNDQPAQQTPPAPASTPAAGQQAPAQPASAAQPAVDQAPSATPVSAPQASTPPPAPGQTPPAAAASASPSASSAPEASSITEDFLRQQFQGKTFYIRGGYLDNSLHFNDHGLLDGTSPQASYTLSLVQIDRVHLDKKHVEFEGVRYGLHFLGLLASEDQTQAIDKVRLTTKKKPLRITIDREDVVKPKKEKEPKPAKASKNKGPVTVINPAHPAAAPAEPAQASPAAQTPAAPQGAATPAPAAAQPAQAPPESQPTASQPAPPSPATPAPASPATPASVQGGVQYATPAERHGVSVTTSQAEADRVLKQAFDRIFSPGIDDRMIATLPDYWKLFYKSVAAKQDYRPTDSSVLRQGQVDQKARLLSVFEPPSNEYAQNNGVAGMAMYHVVVGADGKPAEIAIGRPIGFGLDESAVTSIRKASFQPAIKNGRPVPVVLDLVVQFRIYSKRTAVAAAPQAAGAPATTQAPMLPGPYTANEPRRPAEQPSDQPAPQPSDQPAQPPPSQPADQPAQPPPSQPASPPQPQPQPQ
jgi:TonB family protein